MTITIDGTNGITTPEVTLDNSAADGGQVVLKSSGYSNWNLDNYSGRLRGYYGSTEYFTVTNSGNVGIGTSSPVARTDSLANSSDLAFAARAKSSGAGQSVIAMSAVDSGYANYATAIYQANSHVWRYAGTTEAMRIDSSGNLLVGTTSNPGGGFGGERFVSVASSSSENGGLFKSNGAANVGTALSCARNSGGIQISFHQSGSFLGNISTNGSSTSYNTSSDYRLKENIQPMQNALDVVAQLNPVRYTWKADGSDGQGFIAHELQAVVPDCVTGEKDAVDEEGKPVYQGIDTSFLVATLCKAIQEQQAQIETLTAKVAALEAK